MGLATGLRDSPATPGDTSTAQRAAAGYWRGIYGQWPSWGKLLNPCQPWDIDDRVAGKVKSNLIRYSKSKGRAA